jgi:CMP-N,N'-diacetyllegionaminic acid synthase
MIEDKTILAIIPARGGSKGIPRKNICEVAGKPLIAWTIAAANQSRYLDRFILSSEDEEIIQVAQEWGCEVPFRRPFELALDNTPSMNLVIHALSQLPHYDYVVLLQPTSPLRTHIDIDACIEKCFRQNSNTCVSVTESSQSPYWMYTIGDADEMRSLFPSSQAIHQRQELPKVYMLNGAVYVAKCDWLLQNQTFIDLETLAYIMPPERSLDIDTKLDLVAAKILLNQSSGILAYPLA